MLYDINVMLEIMYNSITITYSINIDYLINYIIYQFIYYKVLYDNIHEIIIDTICIVHSYYNILISVIIYFI